MGNDGGVIAVKRKFMRHANQKAKGEKLDQDALRAERAQMCAISEEPLQEPVVACELGNLYNKQALLEHLLAKSMPERFQHITSLKDVITCRFTRQGGEHNGFMCPVTMLELNGKHPFVLMWGCGCVLSEKAIKEVQTSECLVCGKPTEDKKIVALLQSEEQYMEGQKRILERKAAEKLVKKEGKKKGDKKRQRDGEAGGDDKGHRKDKKQRAEKEARAGASSSAIVQEAAAAIEEAKAKNKVFASLFSKDKSEKKQSANDLLMAVGGMRYTLS